MSNTFGFGPLDFGSLTGMSDGLDLMKRAWAPFNLPSNMTPTMDIDELDKRIADLKTVEQWLNMNLGMLRGTIQTMEIQRGTLAALQEMGRTFTGAAASATPAGAGDAAAQMLAAFGALQKTLGGFGRRQASEPAASAQAPSDPAPAAPGGWPGSASARAQPHTAGSTTGTAGTTGTAQGEAAPAADTTRADAPAGPNPALWWDLLQRQFQQVAQAALAGGGLAPHAVEPQTAPDTAGTAETAPAPARARKPRAAPVRGKTGTRAPR